MRILLMAGGGGTRLWPLSTEEKPKQFLALLSEKSLLVETYERLLPVSREVFVAASARHADLVRRDLPDLPAARLLSEPARRNSGPAVLAAALRFAGDGDPVTLAVPSDQTVRDAEAFRNALRAAAGLADRASVVILGVPPTRPETDYGYVEVRGDAVGKFVEKPDSEKALEYSTSGRHLWNAGIFVFRPSRLLAESRRVAGDLVAGVERVLRTSAAAPVRRKRSTPACARCPSPPGGATSGPGARCARSRARATRPATSSFRPCPCWRPACGTRPSSSARPECWCSRSSGRRS
jgi:mannose-1-phosphate guanylyltransferase